MAFFVSNIFAIKSTVLGPHFLEVN